MPLVGTLMGGLNFAGLAVQVGGATIKYGKFIQTSVDFVIVAAAIFFAVRLGLFAPLALILERAAALLP